MNLVILYGPIIFTKRSPRMNDLKIISEKINAKYHDDYSDPEWCDNITPSHFLDSGKNNLLISVGESWTNYFLHRDGPITSDRYWGLNLSERLDADWLNIASPGFSNHWMLENLLCFHPWFINTRYKKIWIVVCMTEIGRELPDFKVFNYDFYNELRPRLTSSDTIDQVIDYQIIKTMEKMQQVISVYKDIDIFFGSNFSNILDYMRTDQSLKHYLLDKDWVDLIAERYQLPDPPKCEFIFSETLVKHKEFLSDNSLFDINKTWVNLWLIKMMDRLNIMLDWLKTVPCIDPRSYKHVDAHGREIWVEYLLKKIKEKPLYVRD